MPLEDFIIATYCLICDAMKSALKNQSLRRRGYPPALSDEEVITMEIVGAFLGLEQDKALHQYFCEHWKTHFPKLGERSTFARQAFNLWHVKKLIHQELVTRLDARESNLFLTDGFPVPVCKFARAHFSRQFKGEAAFGYCAAKKETYFGFKGMLLSNAMGVVIDVGLVPANVDEREALLDLDLSGLQGALLGDKGFISPQLRQTLAQGGLNLQTPVRNNMKETRPKAYLSCLLNTRRLVETVIGQLSERFSLEKSKARDLWHLVGRIYRKVLAHTACIMLNLAQGNPPLQFERLLATA